MTIEEFTLNVIGTEWDEQDDNIDVFVTLPSGIRYVITFYTMKNIATLRNRWKSTGEYSGGIYFWATNYIIVDDLRMTTILTVTKALMLEGEFEKVFEKCVDDWDSEADN